MKLFFIFLLISLTACNQMNEEKTTKIELFDTGNLHRFQGFYQSAHINEITYFFQTNSEETNLKLVQDIIPTIDFLQDLLPQQSHIRTIYFVEDKSAYRIGSSFIAFNPNDLLTTGFLGYGLSNGELPFWLAVGIERFAQSEVGKSFPIIEDSAIAISLGDLAFAPWKSEEERMLAIQQAYEFVRFLNQNNLLHLALENSSTEVLQPLFYEFRGEALDDDFALNFRLLTTRGIGGTYVTHSDKGYSLTYENENLVIRFIFQHLEHSFLLERKLVLVEAISDSFAWLLDWYDYDISLPATIELYYGREDEIAGGIFYSPFQVAVVYHLDSLNDEFLLHIAIHELSHLITHQVAHSHFVPFDEGLADFLGFYYLSQRPSHVAMWESWFESGIANELRNLNHPIVNQAVLSLEENFSLIKMRELLAFLNPIFRNLSHPAAQPIGFLWRYTDTEADDYFEEIDTYITAESFIRYLITTYGQDKYLQVHWLGIEKFQEVYGITIEEAILSWQAHLERFLSN